MHLKNRVLIVLTWAFFCVALTGATSADDIPEGIIESFNKGNSRELARHFNNNVELVVLDNEDIYSKSQAELILRNFFSVNTPVKFELLHHGGKESKFGIGNLETKNGIFMVYFLLKPRDGVQMINLLRIERVEESS